MFLTTSETGFFLACGGIKPLKREVAQLLARKKVAFVSGGKAGTKACCCPTCQKDGLASIHHLLETIQLPVPSSRWLIFMLFCLCVSCSFQDRRIQGPSIDFSVQLKRQESCCDFEALDYRFSYSL